MRFFIALIYSFFIFSFSANASEDAKIFGLSIGAVLSPKPIICPNNSETSKSPCWIGKPFSASNGDKLGAFFLPNPDKRPEWAAHREFTAQLTKSGVLSSLSVKVIDGNLKHTIANSITNRFGLPNQTTLPQEISSAKWYLPDLTIAMLCSKRMCQVDFISKEERDKRDLAKAKLDSLNKTRPTSP